jgi:hypothetical protein
MTRAKTIERYWPAFLIWVKEQHEDADGFLDTWAANVLAKPTEECFWRWYAEEQL